MHLGIIKCFLLQIATNVRLAQLDRAFGYGPKGRGFESSNARRKGLKYSPFYVHMEIFFPCLRVQNEHMERTSQEVKFDK